MPGGNAMCTIFLCIQVHPGITQTLPASDMARYDTDCKHLVLNPFKSRVPKAELVGCNPSSTVDRATRDLTLLNVQLALNTRALNACAQLVLTSMCKQLLKK